MSELIGSKVYLPEKVRLEACTLCQLNCKSCNVRKSENYCGRGAGYLKFDDFVKFLEMNPFVKEIELSNQGEIFLAPDLYKIIEYAYNKGVTLSAWNGVNFNTVSDEMLEYLVKYKFYALSIAIDGASQETYSQYRRNGNFDKVINNIKKLNEYKKKYNSVFPHIGWQYIIFESNQAESEIKMAKVMACYYNCHMTFVKDWDGFIPDDVEMVEKETGLCYKNADIPATWAKKRWLFCLSLWNHPQINYDGRLMGCVYTKKDFGLNVFELGLEECLNSKIVRDTKRMLMGGPVCKESHCKDCNVYKKIASEKNFVTKEEISARDQWT